MTFDNRGNQYFGPIVAVSPDGLNISTRGRNASDGNGNGYDVRGGALYIVNGTGAGQLRRIIDFSCVVTANGSSWFTIDAPFDVAPQPSTSQVLGAQNGASLISAVPFRGRSIFHGNHFSDTGAHQTYGIGLDTIVAANTAQRFGGFKAWGQTRTGGRLWTKEKPGFTACATAFPFFCLPTVVADSICVQAFREPDRAQ